MATVFKLLTGEFIPHLPIAIPHRPDIMAGKIFPVSFFLTTSKKFLEHDEDYFSIVFFDKIKKPK